MRTLKIVGLVVLVVVLGYVFVEKDHFQQFFQEEEKHEHNHDTHNHDSDDEQEARPFYQGEVISVEHGGGYTYLEIMEKTDMSFWIAVNKVEANVGDYVSFQKELVAQDFYSKALDRTFDEIMFASNLQYKVEE